MTRCGAWRAGRGLGLGFASGAGEVVPELTTAWSLLLVAELPPQPVNARTTIDVTTYRDGLPIIAGNDCAAWRSGTASIVAAMREIFPGVFHWTAFHKPIRTEVSSYYVQPAGIVLDPKVPEGGFETLPGAPTQVVLTSGHHARDSQSFADEFGIPIRVSREGAEHLGGALSVETFADGEEVAPRVTAIHIGVLSEDEGALHLAFGDGALAFADGINAYGDELGFFSDELLGDDPEGVKTGLKHAFGGLLTLDFDHLLFAHGQPVIGGGKAALRDFAG